MPYRQNFPIPAVIDPPKCCLVIEIPDHPDWKAVISGLLFELSYWFNWERTGDMSGAECAAVWKRVYNSIDWSGMACGNGGNCCTPPAITIRINPTTGLSEQSTNNGETWTPMAGGFQSVIVEPVPPVTSGVAATVCDAATNVSGQAQVWIDNASNGFDTATSLLEFGLAVIAAVAAAVLTVLTDGLLLPLAAQTMLVLGAALAAVWGVGKTVFDAYWTTDIKDQIFCAAVCNIGDDGSFNDAQFSAFWNQVNGDLPPSPAKMLFMGFLSSVGRQGLNAMAASGSSADGDCSDCNCDCPDQCDTVWTFYGVHDVVFDGCNTYSMKADGTPVHVAFSSGSDADGCYCTDGGFNLGNWWPLGSGSPVGGTNPKTTPIWNYDAGDPPAETVFTFTFSSAPIT